MEKYELLFLTTKISGILVNRNWFHSTILPLNDNIWKKSSFSVLMKKGLNVLMFSEKCRTLNGCNHRWTRSKILEGGVVSFPEWGGVNFSNQRGVTPPSTPKKFSPAAHFTIIFDCTFFINNNALNDIVSPPQAKIFIKGVEKVQN